MIIQNTNTLGQATPLDLHADNAVPKVVAQTSSQATPEPSPQQLKQAVDGINLALQPTNSNLEFNIDPGTKRLVVRVVDKTTGDVIRQFPSKEILAIAESIGQYQKGLLLRQEA
ncbi:MAG TPA: flagellar protein FlaG [Rhodocyclaceae bacterium]|nr:flagellar protein FlaG [Rhodocyclaceae bacterium]